MTDTLENVRIAVIGLGYVGLPLAVEFGKHFPTVGFDINTARVNELKNGQDHTREVSPAELREARLATYTDQIEALNDANVYIVTVPTPVDDNRTPDLTPLIKASATIGKVIKQGDIVIYESTVYPGCTEEVCIPVIEKTSGLIYNMDFYAGYSPERINPGDKERRLTNILKVTSGSTPEIASRVDALYGKIITAGTFKCTSLAVAEACKVIENTQRDVNIALINELALIFRRLNINTEEVLKAAGTKWNFLPFRPGLVGGHCIGVDPYYLVHKAQRVNYYPELIVAARRINDNMGRVVSNEVMRLMTQRRIHIVDSKILVLGLAFKENCPDLRNTRVCDIVNELRQNNANVDIYDPWVDHAEARHEFGLDLLASLKNHSYDAIIIAVAHHQFSDMGIDAIRRLGKSNHIIFDIKYLFGENEVDGRL